MAQSEVPIAPSKEWAEFTMESIKNDLKMLETNPEGYSEYFKDLERKQQLAAPQSQPEGDQWPRMEANMKALIDYDPELLKGFDMERMKTSWDFANKVKQRFESDPERYNEYLRVHEDVSRQPGRGAWERLHNKVKVILVNDPDLLKIFESLAPPSNKAGESASKTVEDESSSEQKE